MFRIFTSGGIGFNIRKTIINQPYSDELRPMVGLVDPTRSYKTIRHIQPSSYAWRLIPLSKWVITPVIHGISRVNPLITGGTTHLLSGMSHQVVTLWWCYLLVIFTCHGPNPSQVRRESRPLRDSATSPDRNLGGHQLRPLACVVVFFFRPCT